MIGRYTGVDSRTIFSCRIFFVFLAYCDGPYLYQKPLVSQRSYHCSEPLHDGRLFHISREQSPRLTPVKSIQRLHIPFIQCKIKHICVLLDSVGIATLGERNPIFLEREPNQDLRW